MGFLFTKLWTKLLGTKDVRILMVGLDAAGKTTILYQLRMGETIKTIPTIGFNVETLEYKGVNFTVWDVGGQDKIRVLWKHYYQNTDGLIFVVDSNDRERIGDAAEELKKMLAEDELKDCVVLIMANKQDIDGALSPADVTKELVIFNSRFFFFVFFIIINIIIYFNFIIFTSLFIFIFLFAFFNR